MCMSVFACMHVPVMPHVPSHTPLRRGKQIPEAYWLVSLAKPMSFRFRERIKVEDQ